MRRFARHVTVALIVEAVCLPLVLLELAPHLPKTWLGWVLVILFGPLLCFGGEALFDWMIERTPDDPMAIVVYAVGGPLLMLGMLLGGFILLSMLLADYLRPHFY